MLFRSVAARGGSRSRRKPEQLRSRGQLYVEELTPEPLPASEASVGLMVLTGISCAVGVRQQPLYSVENPGRRKASRGSSLGL